MIKAAQATDETRTLTESAYRLIRSDILSGLVAPKDKLHISDLSQRHGTSASAIREALSRLVSEGLATMDRKRSLLGGPLRRDSSVEHQMLQTTALARETEKACALIAQHFLKTYETYRANVEVS